MPTKPPPARFDGAWTQTGRWRWRRRLLRRPVLEVELERWRWEPEPGRPLDRRRHETIWREGESWDKYPEGGEVA